MTTSPATTKIATCYRSEPSTDRRCVEIRRDNKTGNYVVTEICNGVGDETKFVSSESDALKRAEALGFPDVVRA